MVWIARIYINNQLLLTLGGKGGINAYASNNYSDGKYIFMGIHKAALNSNKNYENFNPLHNLDYNDFIVEINRIQYS